MCKKVHGGRVIKLEWNNKKERKNLCILSCAHLRIAQKAAAMEAG